MLCISFPCPVSQKITVKTAILEHGGGGGGGLVFLLIFRHYNCNRTAGFHVCDRFNICNRLGTVKCESGYKCEKNHHDSV